MRQVVARNDETEFVGLLEFVEFIEYIEFIGFVEFVEFLELLEFAEFIGLIGFIVNGKRQYIEYWLWFWRDNQGLAGEDCFTFLVDTNRLQTKPILFL